MHALKRLLLALGASVLLYLVTFLWVHKPLTFDPMLDVVALKRTAMQRAQPPRLFILAGSNGLYSHSCETLQPLVGRPCINLSLVSGVSIEYALVQYADLFRPGDTIYMPLEYLQYVLNRAHMFYAPENVLLYQRQRHLLMQLDWVRVAQSIASFSLTFLVQGGIEMVLHQIGSRPRLDPAILNSFGDMQGHTAERARVYRERIARTMLWTPSAAALGADTDAKQEIARFIQRLGQEGVLTIGGLPTMLDDTPIDPAVVQTVRQFFMDNGARFIALPNLSQYPRDQFFDSALHLSEESQREHSRALAPHLADLLVQADP